MGHLVIEEAEDQPHKRASALTGLVGSLLLLSSSLAVAQSEGKCALFGTPQVNPTLVQLDNHGTRSSYRRGEPIHVTLTLRAGAEGVYLPDFFGAFQETCTYGFATEVLTFTGKAANPHEPGCAYAGGVPKIQAVELKPGEMRTWSTDLSTRSIAPGHYCLYAEYLIAEQPFGWAVNLPHDRSLVAKGRITATPMPIEIR
jgi:hypothetical protein